MQRFDWVVIGSGPGEQRAAIRAAKLGGSVAIVERATEVGGVVGLEYGSMLAALGVGVTRVDQRTQFLEMVERELVDAFCTRAREMGLTLRLGAAPPRGWHSSMPGSGRMTAGRSR